MQQGRLSLICILEQPKSQSLKSKSKSQLKIDWQTYIIFPALSSFMRWTMTHFLSAF